MELLSLVEDGQTALSTATHAALEANGIRLLPSHVERIAAAKRNALAETDRIELRPGTVDDEGRVYRWDPADWEYNELMPGWNGEEWSCDLD